MDGKYTIVFLYFPNNSCRIC